MRIRFFSTTALLLILTGVCFGQKVNFAINVPTVVGLNEPFKVEFSVNASYSDFKAPSLSGFDVLAGPSTAHGQSISIVNGSMTKSVNYTITYVLQPRNTGKYTIPAAEVTVEGRVYSTKPTVVEVAADPGAAAEQGSGQSQQGQGQGGTATQGKNIAADDLFVTVTVDKNTVYKGQPIKATFKIYTRGIPNTIENTKNPAFNGFWTQELGSASYQWQRENYRGKVYDSRVIRELLLYPQQSGTLHIEQFDANVIAQIVVRQSTRSMEEEMMGLGQQVLEVRKKLTAPPVRINVQELPAGAPKSFNGAVGSFTMTSDAPKGPIAANSGANISVRVSGSGNLPLVQFPKIVLPASFEQYNTKTTESLSASASGITGYRQFEFPFIARAEGNYNLEPIEFSYFSPEQLRYVTLSSGSMSVRVLRDSTGTTGSANQGGTLMSALSKEDVMILGQDIRFIKLGSPGLHKKERLLIGGWLYFCLLGVILAMFAAAFIYLREQIKNAQNIALVRSKKANKVALARLRNAEQLMKQSDQRRFYEEMLKALWGYMSDKLNIPGATLTKESIRDGLAKRRASASVIDKYIGIISDCEYAQYSPDGGGHMEEAYNAAIDIISRLESGLKR